MSQIILLRGPLGVGKTTLAKRLAAKLHAHYLSIDSVLEENHLDQAEDEGISVKNFIRGNELVLPEIKSALAEGKLVVIDGCFYHKEQIEHFKNMLKKETMPPRCREWLSVAVFTLKAPVDVCIARDKEREKPYGEDAARIVHLMVSRFDAGTVIETADKTVDQVLKEILGYLMQ